MKSIAETVRIGTNVTIGEFVVIEDDVIIGDNCTIGHHAVIHRGSVIGNNVRIDDHAVIGKQPMRAALSLFKGRDKEEKPPCQIGDDCIIGTSATVYAGSQLGQGCMVADLATVREDVTIGDLTIVGRGVSVGMRSTIGARCKIETNTCITGFSEIEDDVFIGPCVATTNDNSAGRDPDRFSKIKGLTARRKVRIGANATILPGKVIGEDAFVGAGALVTKDVPAGVTVVGNPAKPKIS